MAKKVISAAAALFAAAILAGGALAPAAMAMSDPKPKSQADDTQRMSDKGSKQKLYCVIETPTGSHIRTKDCRTRADWIAATGIDPAEEARK